jgi:hypothetical protein
VGPFLLRRYGSVLYYSGVSLIAKLMHGVWIFARAVQWRKRAFPVNHEPLTKFMIFYATATFEYPPPPRFFVVGGDGNGEVIGDSERAVWWFGVGTRNRDYQPHRPILIGKAKCPSRLACHFNYNRPKNIERLLWHNLL